MKSRITKSLFGAAALIAVAAVINPSSAFAATSGTATLTAGTLSYTSPLTLDFGSTALTGAAQSLPASQVFDVVDATSSDAGWNVTATSTTFTTGTDSLPATAATDTAAAGACDVTAPGCILGDTSAISYPVAIPAAVSAPAAVKIQSAAVNTGEAAQSWTHSMALAIPTLARPGAYTSTWTYSLVSAP